MWTREAVQSIHQEENNQVLLLVVWFAARQLNHVSIFFMHYEKQSYTVQAVFPVYKNGLVLHFNQYKLLIHREKE